MRAGHRNFFFTAYGLPQLSYSLPLGLILNEAITNSIKYAFPDIREGIIRIELYHTAADNIRLIISDNEIGIPVKKDQDIKSSMGLNLMSGLTEDIGGIFHIGNENGTTIQIDFACEMLKYQSTTKIDKLKVS